MFGIYQPHRPGQWKKITKAGLVCQGDFIAAGAMASGHDDHGPWQDVEKLPIRAGCSKIFRCKTHKNRKGWRIAKYVERGACPRNCCRDAFFDSLLNQDWRCWTPDHAFGPVCPGRADFTRFYHSGIGMPAIAGVRRRDQTWGEETQKNAISSFASPSPGRQSDKSGPRTWPGRQS